MQPQTRPTGNRLLHFPASLQQQTPALPAPAPAATGRKLTPALALLHDARNALASLYLLSGLLREPGVLAPSHAHFAEDLDQVTGMLGGLLQGFAPGGTPETEAPAAPRARTAGEALQGCAGLLQAVGGTRVAVHVSAESNLPPLRIEDGALARVLTNLVKNAAEAMTGGSVTITARRALGRTHKAVLVHVSDDGPGIPAHALPSIFEPGFSSKPQRGGPDTAEPCGLGLAIVRELVEASGGAVRVASTRRRGTTFELRLPCRAEETPITSVTGEKQFPGLRIGRNTLNTENWK